MQYAEHIFPSECLPNCPVWLGQSEYESDAEPVMFGVVVPAGRDLPIKS